MKTWIRQIYSLVLDPSFWVYAFIVGISLLLNWKIGILFFILFPILFNFLPFFWIKKLESKYKVINQGSSSICHVLVLGGGHEPNENIIPEQRLNETSIRRVIEGVRLTKLFPFSKLVMSGEALKKNHPSQAELQMSMATLFGIDSKKITIIPEPFNTEEEAIYYFRTFGFHDFPVLLVSKAIHLPRACYIFERFGYSILPAPAYFIHQYFRPQMFWFIKPDFNLILSFKELIKELVGLFWLKSIAKIGVNSYPEKNYNPSLDPRQTSFQLMNK